MRTSKMRGKLFGVGPTHVTAKNREALLDPLVNHRSPEFAEVLAELTKKVKTLFSTSQEAFILSISARGAMEGAIRNCVQTSVLNVANGNFGELWHDISKACAKEADLLSLEWGKAVRSEHLEEALSKKSYEAITLVHNESSTGVANPLEELAEVIRRYPTTLFLVDTVSSMGGVKIDVDALGIDVCVTGTQKCLALDPGLSLVSVSDRAMKKSKTVTDKGYYLDFVVQKKYLDKGQPVPTPPLPQINQLQQQLKYILEEEGLEQRYARHDRMASFAQDWAKGCLGLFAEEAFASKTLTVVKNTPNISVEKLNKYLQEEGIGLIAGGYGPLKGKTFRIGHMGDLTEGDVQAVTSAITRYLSK